MIIRDHVASVDRMLSLLTPVTRQMQHAWISSLLVGLNQKKMKKKVSDENMPFPSSLVPDTAEIVCRMLEINETYASLWTRLETIIAEILNAGHTKLMPETNNGDSQTFADILENSLPRQIHQSKNIHVWLIKFRRAKSCWDAMNEKHRGQNMVFMDYYTATGSVIEV